MPGKSAGTYIVVTVVVACDTQEAKQIPSRCSPRQAAVGVPIGAATKKPISRFVSESLLQLAR